MTTLFIDKHLIMSLSSAWHWPWDLCRDLQWSYIIKNTAVITAAVITTHHEIKVKLSRDLWRGECCSSDRTVAFKKIIISLYLRTRQRTHSQCPDNTNKFILFWEKYQCFSVSIYKYIWSSCRSTGHFLLLVFGSQMTLFPVKCIVGLVFIVDI